MSRIAAILILIFLLAEKGYSQQKWVWQNPLPQGNTLNAIQATDASTGYAGGADGSLIKTVSSGLHWYSISFPINANITSIDFLDNNHGWVAGTMGNSAYLYQTTDGGNYWKQLLKTKARNISIDLLNNNVGWASADSILYFTNDSGRHWTKHNLHLSISHVFFLNIRQGWLTSGNRVYRTSDGGLNWEYVALNQQPIRGLGKIQFLNASVGYVIGTFVGFNEEDGYLFKTTDGGITWNQVLSVGGSFIGYATFTDMDFLDENTGWVVAEDQVYKTTNGRDWKQVSTASNLNHITAINHSTVWGAGNYGSLFLSGDGGKNWQKTNGGDVVSTEDLQILNNRDIFVAGGSTLLKTTDGGKTWTSLKVTNLSKNFVNIHAVWFINSENGWIGVENIGGWGGLYKTSDGGKTWISQLGNQHNLNRVFDIYFINDKTGWFFAGNKAYRTDDSGQTWNQISAINADVEIECVYFVSDEVGYAGGYLGLYKTTDGGNSWTKVKLNISDPFIHSIYFVNNQTGWATGNSGNGGLVLKTTDGGSHWSVDNLPQVTSYIYPQSIDFKNKNDGWVVGNGDSRGIAFHSSDGGDTWQKYSFPTNSNLWRIAFSDSTDGWVLGDHGAILHYSPTTAPPDSNGNGGIPVTFTLNQNYPNPFNPSTQISYFLPGDGPVQLNVYNLIGQKVAVLVHSYQSAGDHTVTFHPNGLSSGIYFYELEFNGASVMKNMLFLK